MPVQPETAPRKIYSVIRSGTPIAEGAEGFGVRTGDRMAESGVARSPPRRGAQPVKDGGEKDYNGLQRPLAHC